MLPKAMLSKAVVLRIGLMAGLAGLGSGGLFVPKAWALPPDEEINEEVLRTEIITEARSPIDGQPLTPAEYAELQAALQETPQNNPKYYDERRLKINLQQKRADTTQITNNK